MRYIISFSIASLLALPATAEVPRVVTDLAPIGSLVAQVMGDLGAPMVLLDRGADAHAFQLRPSQAADLAGAQAVIWVGPEMTPWLERALDGLGGGAVDLRLLAVPGTVVQPFGEAEGGHDPAAAAGAGGGDAGHDPDHAQGHDHGDVDPHAWLDPGNAALWLGAIAETLAGLDPEHATTYAANAASAQASLKALDAEVQALLAPARGVPLVVFHDAYGYFAGHYGLAVLGAISDGDAASPGAAHLRDLQARIGAGPACVFPEANHDPKLLEALAGAPGLKIGAPLDPEGSTLPGGAALYGQVLRAMARAIADCAAG